jgi:hypothetical protein
VRDGVEALAFGITETRTTTGTKYEPRSALLRGIVSAALAITN